MGREYINFTLCKIYLQRDVRTSGVPNLLKSRFMEGEAYYEFCEEKRLKNER